jgi:putative peptidoglycan lipid II flippase
MKLIRSVATISFFTAGSRIFGFIREIIMASYLGASIKSDALVVAIKLPSILRRIFAEGAFNTTFIPMFSRLLSGSSAKEAKTFAEEVLSILVFSLAFIVLFIEIFIPYLMPIFAPGFKETPERLYLAIEYTRLTFPFIFFISLTALYSGILNSFERFVAVAVSPMMGNIAIIATVFAMVALNLQAGYAFAMGVCACGVIQLLWVMVPAHQNCVRLRLRWPTISPNVKKFLLLAGPAAAGSGIVQINILLDTVMASKLPAGGVSFIHYADRLNQLPLSMLGTAMGTALLPLMSKKARAGDRQGLIDTQNLALEYALLFVVPAAIGLFLLAQPLMSVLFERGDFGARESTGSAEALMGLALGLPAYIMIKIFSSNFFSRQDTKTPVKYAICSVVINFTLNVLLIDSLQHVGLTLATAIAAWVNAAMLLVTLIKEKNFELSPRMKVFLPRLLATSALSIGFIVLIKAPILSWISEAFTQKALCLTLLMGGSIGSFIVLARLTGALDMKDLKLQLKAV